MRRILFITLAAVGLFAAPAYSQSSFPGTLPVGCQTNDTAIYNATTRVWNCGTPAGGGDVTASGTLANNAVALGGGSTTVKTTTTGTGVVTAIGINGGSAGALAKLGSGTPATNDCVKFDASNNLVTAGAACGSGGGGAPTDATYITQTANGSLSNEQAMGSLGTGLVKNTTTTGVQSIYAGATCTNQFIRVLDASAAATCASVANADLAGSIALSKLATQAATTVVMNNTGGAAAPTAVDMASLATALGIIDIPSLTTGDILYASATDTLSALAIGSNGECLKITTGLPDWASCSGTGDVVGPGSSTDNAIARFDSTTGKLIQNSAVTVADTTGVIAGTQGVTFSNATSGTVALATVAGALGTVTASLPARTGTVALETGSTFTTGTIQLQPIYLWGAAVCQNTTASIGTSLWTSGTPTAACKTGSNTTFGVAQYTATAQQIQGMMLVPYDLTNTTVLLKAAYMGETTSSGNVTWTFSYARVAAGSTMDPSWNDITVTDAAGTANQLNIISQSMTLTGLSANDILFWKFTYTTAPTTPGNQDLIQLSLVPLRTYTIGG